jgi:hypothetical protein
MSYEVSAGEWAHPHIGRLTQPAYTATRHEAGAGAPDTEPPDMAPGTRPGLATTPRQPRAS